MWKNLKISTVLEINEVHNTYENIVNFFFLEKIWKETDDAVSEIVNQEIIKSEIVNRKVSLGQVIASVIYRFTWPHTQSEFGCGIILILVNL